MIEVRDMGPTASAAKKHRSKSPSRTKDLFKSVAQVAHETFSQLVDSKTKAFTEQCRTVCQSL